MQNKDRSDDNFDENPKKKRSNEKSKMKKTSENPKNEKVKSTLSRAAHGRARAAADTDFDVNNYSKAQLYKILGLDINDDPPDSSVINNIKALKENTRDLRVVDFLNNMRNKLVGVDEVVIDGGDMFQREYTKTRNDNTDNFRTNRFQQVTTVDDETENFVMFRNKLNVSNTKATNILQGTLNPNLKNIIQRTVNIDTQYRKYIYDKFSAFNNASTVSTSSTDFVMELSEHLPNVIGMKLYSYSIPTTWYVFSKKLGNTCLEIVDRNSFETGFLTDGSSNELPYCDCIEDGNPKFTELTDSLNDTFGTFLLFEFFRSSGKMRITNKTDKNIRIYFYRPSGFGVSSLIDSTTNNTPCNKGCSAPGFSNNNLGWELGFRPSPDVDTGEVYIDIDASGTDNSSILGSSIVNINGPKYFTLSLDDFNQNHINKGMINILEKDETVSLPSYYNPVDKDYEDETIFKNDNTPESGKEETDTNVESLACTELLNKNNTKIPYVKKNVIRPRKLTSAQIYSINQIISSRHRPVTRTPTPGISNTFAHINIDNIRKLVEEREPLTGVGTNLQMNSRVYFGPVHIRRLRVTLYDDKGNIVDLNGHDWCFTLIIDMLYQY